MIHYNEARHLRFQQPFSLLAKADRERIVGIILGMKVLRRSLRSIRQRLYSATSINHLHNIQSYILHYLAASTSLKFLPFFCRAALSPDFVAASEGTKTDNVASAMTFLFKFCCKYICLSSLSFPQRPKYAKTCSGRI